MKEQFNCNENTFEVLKKFAVNNYDRRRRTNKKKEEEKLNMIKEYYPPSASIDNKPVVVQLKLTDENPDEILAKEKERLKAEQEKKEREQREREEEEKMKNIVTKEQMEIMKIKDMAIECITNTSNIFDALYYHELPRFKNNGELEEEKEELEKEKRREKEGYYKIIVPPNGALGLLVGGYEEDNPGAGDRDDDIGYIAHAFAAAEDFGTGPPQPRVEKSTQDPISADTKGDYTFSYTIARAQLPF